MNMDGNKNSGLHFRKMHGLGNDFVVIDARGQNNPMSPALARAIGDRHFGIGFDQLAVIENADNVAATVEYWNIDGSKSDACGNATRCIANLLMQESGHNRLTLRTGRGDLDCENLGNGIIRVNMGHPILDWQEIPLAKEVDTISLPIAGEPTATSMGNPHCTFFVPDAETVDIDEIGYKTENDPLFPERTNVQVAQIIDRNNIRVRVWERGVGLTLASGSSSCAVVVAAARKGLADRNATVHLDGGKLSIEWADDGVWMAGPTMLVAEGYLSSDFLETVI